MYVINELCDRYRDYMIKIRRDIHMNPEASNKEYETAKLIRRELDQMNIEYDVIETSTIAYIYGRQNGKTVALRADIDALELEELNNITYKSKNSGVMHACGHDSHTAALLGTAKILKDLKDKLNGTVVLIFQQAEEIAYGAKLIVDNGYIDNIDSILSVHVTNELPVGYVNIENGPRMASAGKFTIHVKGFGGHGAAPHQTKDAIVIGSQIVNSLQQIISRQIDPLQPAVITVGMFNSGSRFNIIANDAYIVGSMRCYTNEIATQLEDAIITVAKNTAKAFGAEADVDCEWLLLPIINDKKIVNIAKKAISTTLGEEAFAFMEKVTGSEDMSVYFNRIPGAIAFVGSNNDLEGENYPLHHSKFNIDEESIINACKVYSSFAIEYLNDDISNN